MQATLPAEWWGLRDLSGNRGKHAKLAESIDDFFSAFEATPAKTPHQIHEVVEKDHGRMEVRRCHVCKQLDCLHAPERWPGLELFAVITGERTIRGTATSTERRVYLSSLPPDARRLNQSIRLYWCVENSLHWCMEVVFGDDQMRAGTDHAAHNLAAVGQFILNLIRLSAVKRKGGLKVQRLIAATSDTFRAELLGLVRDSCDCLALAIVSYTQPVSDW